MRGDLFVHLVEEAFNVDIILFSKDKFLIPPHKYVYYKTKPSKPTVFIYQHMGSEQELEADRIGLIYMARAGYDPREAVAFWQRFQAYSAQHGGGKTIAFLSTHPLDDVRIERIRALLPQAMAEYRKAK